MKKLLDILDSPITFAACIGALLVTNVGVVLISLPSESWTVDGLWGQRIGLMQFAEFAYLLVAPRVVMGFTPGLVERLRPVVRCPDDEFAAIARKIAGRLPVRVMTAIVIVIVIDALARLPAILQNPAAYTSGSFGPQMGWALLPVELYVLAVSAWRMFWLSRLAARPLNISLLNPGPTFPFSTLSFSYASLLSIRILVHFVLFGSAFGLMLNSFTVFGVMSLLMLIVPIYGAHLQMQREKARGLAEIDNELIALAQPIFSAGAQPVPNIAQLTAPMESLFTLRNRVASLWTWPVSSSFRAVQAVLFSLLPVWLPLIRNYVWPILQQLME